MTRIARVKYLAIAALIAATTIIVAPKPAYAWTFPTVPNCFGLTPNTESTFYLGWGMRNTWGAPGAIWDGDIIQIVAVGVVKIDRWPWGPQYGPEGSGQYAPPGFPYSELGNTARYQMIWSFGAPSIWETYHQGVCIQHFGQHTYLFAQMNDTNFSDNGGEWEVKIRHYWTGS